MSRRFVRMRNSSYDVEDAVSAAMLDLVDYWMRLKSSLDLDDPARNFKWAVWRGKRMATQYLTSQFDENRRTVSIFDAGDDDAALVERIADRAADPADRVCDSYGTKQQVSEISEALNDEAGWIEGYLEGLSHSEIARRQGVTTRAIDRRQQRGLERLRKFAIGQGPCQNEFLRALGMRQVVTV